MKKALTILLSLFVLVACTNIKNYSGILYQVIEDETMNNLDTNNVESIDIFSSKLGAGFNISDPQQLDNLLSLFTQISSKEKVDEFEYVEDNYTFTLCFIDDTKTFTFFDDIVEASDGLCYKVENNGGLIKYIDELITNQFDLDVNYIDLFEYEGLYIKQGKYELKSNGDFLIELLINNTSEYDYGIKLNNVKANNIGINTYQEFGCLANNEIGYDIRVPTSVLNDYGVENIGEVKYLIDVYELDTENLSLLDKLYTSDEFVIDVSEYENNELNLDEPIYDDGDIEVYLKTAEEELYTTLNLCAVNNLDEVVEISIYSLEYNDVLIEDSQLDYYKFNIDEETKTIALFPIYNFEYDEDSQTTSKIEIESLEIELRIETESNIYYSDVITVR